MLICAAAGAHGFGAPRGGGEPALHELGGDAEARAVRVGAAGEDGGDDLAVAVEDGAARIAGPDVGAEAGYGALNRPAIVGVSGDHRPRQAGASGPDVERAVLGEAEHGGRLTRMGGGERHGVEAEAANAQDRHVVLGVEEDDLGPLARPGAPWLDPGDGLSRDDVGVGDYEVGGGDPAGALDAVAAGYAAHA